MKFSLICGVCVLCLVTANIIADVATVAPADPLSTTLGTAGWQPAMKSYTITNTVTDYVYWQADASGGMVNCQPAGSWIAPGSSIPISVSPGSSMSLASAGTYTDQLTLSFDPRVLGDINGDGAVNLYDLKLLVPMWNSVAGSSMYDSSGDFDNSGSINLGDLKALVDHWNKTYGAVSL